MAREQEARRPAAADHPAAEEADAAHVSSSAISWAVRSAARPSAGRRAGVTRRLGTPDVDDRDRAVTRVEDRRRDAVRVVLVLAQAGRIAVAADAFELAVERGLIDDRGRREALERRGQDGCELISGQPGQEDLARRRRVQRKVPAAPVGRGRPGRVGLIDVHEPEALGDGERHDLARRLGRALEQRAQATRERIVVLGGRDLECGIPDDVAPGHGVPLDQTVRLQGRQQAPGRAAVHIAALGELLRAARGLGGRHGLEQPQRAIDGLDARAGTLSLLSHACAFRAHCSHCERWQGRPPAEGAPLYTGEMSAAMRDPGDSLTRVRRPAYHRPPEALP